jgi:hypothetical protein
MFKEKHLVVQVMWYKFQYFKLLFIRKWHEWNSCWCQYHTEISEWKESLNGIKCRAKGSMGNALVLVHKFYHPSGKDIGPIECQTHLKCFKRLAYLCSSILCPETNMSAFHEKECLLGECKTCGIQTFQNYPFEKL